MSYEANFKILESKGNFPAKLAAKSHIYIISSGDVWKGGVNSLFKITNEIIEETKQLILRNGNIKKISLPSI